MHSSLYSLWTIMITLAVLFLVPNVAWCHLGSALKAGSGTLTKFTFGDHVIFCTFNLGEGKPPILSHVRVSRQPRVVYSGDFDSSSRLPILQTSKIKSPSYQHKILQFHGQAPSGQDFYPSKLFYSPSKSSPVYPVASKFGKVDSRQLIGQRSTGTYADDDADSDGGDSWETFSGSWQPNLLPEPENPTFTPYIGARALTNLPQFFLQHLRENIQAIRDSASSSSDQGQVVQEKENQLDESDQVDDDKNTSQEELVKMIATPTRRGYSSNSETDGMPNRDSRSGGPYTLGNTRFLNEEPDEKTRELLKFLGRGKPEYPRANKYNPAWTFTNLGLGKRSHFPSKHYQQR